jgi:hypothetical protein
MLSTQMMARSCGGRAGEAETNNGGGAAPAEMRREASMELLAGLADAVVLGGGPQLREGTGTPPRVTQHDAASPSKRRESGGAPSPPPSQKRRRVVPDCPPGAGWTERDREWEKRDEELTRAFTKGRAEICDASPFTPSHPLYVSLTKVLELLCATGVGEELAIRPNNVDYPGSEALFREQRPQPTRRYARNTVRALDVWKPHGGTSTRRLRLPDAMQPAGKPPQEIVRRSGKIMRPDGLPTLRFRQYEIGTVGQRKTKDASDFVLFHVLPDAVGMAATGGATKAKAKAKPKASPHDITPPTGRSPGLTVEKARVLQQEPVAQQLPPQGGYYSGAGAGAGYGAGYGAGVGGIAGAGAGAGTGAGAGAGEGTASDFLLMLSSAAGVGGVGAI